MPMPTTPPIVSDCVVIDANNKILMIRRGNPPFKGKLALPGGFVDVGETVEEGCRRELREETGIEAGTLKLIGVYSDPKRDPRGHVVSIAYLTKVGDVTATAGDDAAAIEWVSDISNLELAFDHRTIIEDALRLLPDTK